MLGTGIFGNPSEASLASPNLGWRSECAMLLWMYLNMSAPLQVAMPETSLVFPEAGRALNTAHTDVAVQLQASKSAVA